MTRGRHRGFTLIELLIVLGIILLLLGMGVFAYQKYDKVAGDRATRTRLAMCESILSEYEVAATLNSINGNGPGAIYGLGSGLGCPGDVNIGGGDRGGGAVSTTAACFTKCCQIPSAKSMFASLPASSILGTPPVILDGWKNPIVFVPSGGLNGVWIGGQIPRSDADTSTGGPWAHQVNVHSVDNRPFWASAGQDGRFDMGDDNLYSCPVYYR